MNEKRQYIFIRLNSKITDSRWCVCFLEWLNSNGILQMVRCRLKECFFLVKDKRELPSWLVTCSNKIVSFLNVDFYETARVVTRINECKIFHLKNLIYYLYARLSVLLIIVYGWDKDAIFYAFSFIFFTYFIIRNIVWNWTFGMNILIFENTLRLID